MNQIESVPYAHRANGIESGIREKTWARTHQARQLQRAAGGARGSAPGQVGTETAEDSSANNVASEPLTGAGAEAAGNTSSDDDTRQNGQCSISKAGADGLDSPDVTLRLSMPPTVHTSTQPASADSPDVNACPSAGISTAASITKMTNRDRGRCKRTKRCMTKKQTLDEAF